MTREEKIAKHKKNKEANKLPDSVAKNYQMVDGSIPGRFILQTPVKREIDLRSISVAQAKELAANENFPWLITKAPTGK